MPKYAALLVAASFVASLLLRRERLNPPRETFMVMSWLVVAIVSILFSYGAGSGFPRFLTVMQVVGTSTMIYFLILRERCLIPILSMIFCSMAVISGLNLLDREAYSVAGRWVGTLGNANLFGVSLVYAVIVGLFLLIRVRAMFSKALIGAAICLLVYAVVQTGSRKAAIAVPLVLAVATLLYARSSYRLSASKGLLVFFLGAVAVAGAGFAVTQGAHFDRIDRVVRAVDEGDLGEAGESEKGRLMMYQYGLHAALNSPVIGVGLDNFRALRVGSMNQAIGTYSHSNYVEILVTTGFLGFLTYFSMYVSVAARVVKLWRARLVMKDRRLLLSVTLIGACVVFFDFAMVSYYEKVNWLIIAVTLASARLLESNGRRLDARSGALAQRERDDADDRR